jgi:paraquat-inducible protein B
MSKKANPKTIGLFVIGSLVLLVAAVLMFSSNRLFTDRPRYVLFFQGSVQGLQKGSPVVFRGVRIGSVVDIQMYLDPVKMTVFIPVIIENEPDRVSILDNVDETATADEVIQALVAQGLKGQLKSQSFVTGQLLVDFDFHPDKEIRLTGIDMGYKELPTIPSAFEQFTETLQTLPVQEIVENVNSAVEGIERLVNAPEVMDSIKELNQTLKNTRKFTGSMETRLTPVLKEAERTLVDVQTLVQETGTLVKNIDGQVEPLTDDTKEMIQASIKLLEDVNTRITPLLDNINSLTETAKGTLSQATSTLSAYEDMGTEGSPFVDELTTALEELTRTARSLRILLDSIENRPDEFIRGKSSSGGTR